MARDQLTLALALPAPTYARDDFVVAAGNRTIEARGTYFDVDRLADGTTVTLIQGRVRVAKVDKRNRIGGRCCLCARTSHRRRRIRPPCTDENLRLLAFYDGDPGTGQNTRVTHRLKQIKNHCKTVVRQ